MKRFFILWMVAVVLLLWSAYVYADGISITLNNCGAQTAYFRVGLNALATSGQVYVVAPGGSQTVTDGGSSGPYVIGVGSAGCTGCTSNYWDAFYPYPATTGAQTLTIGGVKANYYTECIYANTNGGGTNCTDTLTIANNNTVGNVYKLFVNGVDSGNMVEVDAGSTASFNFANPGCSNNVYKAVFYNIVDNFQCAGSQNFTPGGWMCSGSSINGNPYSTNSLTQGIGVNGSTNQPPSIVNNPNPNGDTPPYTNGVGGNTPIGWTNSSGSATNPLGTGTYQQGSDALYKATVDGDQAIVDAIHQADQHISTAASAATNFLGKIDNDLNAGFGNQSNSMNGLLQASTNWWKGQSNQMGSLLTGETNWWGGQSNQMGILLTNNFGAATGLLSYSWNFTNPTFLTNMGASSASPDMSQYTYLSNALAMDIPPVPDGDDGIYSISAGGYTFDCNPKHYSTVVSLASGLKELITFFVSFVYLFWLTKYCMDHVKEVCKLTQVKLPNMTATILGVGGNWGVLAYPVYIALMVVILGIFPVFVIGLITVKHASLLVIVASGLTHTGVAGNAVSLANYFIPLDYIIGLCVSAMVDMVSVGTVFTLVGWMMRALPGG